MLRHNFTRTYPITRFLFFFNDTATTEIYTLSLHDALPIYPFYVRLARIAKADPFADRVLIRKPFLREGIIDDRDARAIELIAIVKKSALQKRDRSEEHTSELQSRSDLVCRLLLEKKKTRKANKSKSDEPNKHRTCRKIARFFRDNTAQRCSYDNTTISNPTAFASFKWTFWYRQE